MSIIAVSKVHPACTLKQMVSPMSKLINGHFEVLAFSSLNNKGNKLCYLRLASNLDPLNVMEDIKAGRTFGAFIPKSTNKLNLPTVGLRPKTNRFGRHIPVEATPEKVLSITHEEILTELQMKYTGLFELSKKTGHKLLDGISEIILDRLKIIMEKNPEHLGTGFMMSKCYRRLHPHFGDFQLILSTLHRHQDAAGVARDQILEQDLMALNTQPYVFDNIPYKIVQQACTKYSDRIIKKVSGHIKTLKTDMCETDTEEEIARKKVREELKKISQYLPYMIKQVISNHFVPQKSPYQKMRIYGEPFMPTKEQMSPFLRRFRTIKVMRSDRMYNLLRFSIPLAQYASLLAMDGTVICGAKLVIRSSATSELRIGRRASRGAGAKGVEHADEEEPDADQEMPDENWVEDMVV